MNMNFRRFYVLKFIPEQQNALINHFCFTRIVNRVLGFRFAIFILIQFTFVAISVQKGQNSHLNQDCGSLIFEPENLTKKLLKIPDIF